MFVKIDNGIQLDFDTITTVCEKGQWIHISASYDPEKYELCNYINVRILN